jgi:hypothetical protein
MYLTLRKQVPVFSSLARVVGRKNCAPSALSTATQMPRGFDGAAGSDQLCALRLAAALLSSLVCCEPPTTTLPLLLGPESGRNAAASLGRGFLSSLMGGGSATALARPPFPVGMRVGIGSAFLSTSGPPVRPRTLRENTREILHRDHGRIALMVYM